MADDRHGNPPPGNPPPGVAKPVNWQLAAICVLLGLICLAFPFVGRRIEPNLFSTEVYLLSLSMTFGLFLTAVGGWASGSWRGWTFGGAAATVVALFLLIQFVHNPPAPGPERTVVAKISGPELYTRITAVEVMEENGARLFVAPNRRLNHADVLIEQANLDTDCLAFMFAPGGEQADGDAEPIDIKVPSGFFRQFMDETDDPLAYRKRVRLHYHHGSGTLLRNAPTGETPPEPLSGPGVCSGFAQVPADSGHRHAGLFGWISAAFAGDLRDRDLIRLLNSNDALIRRDARAQIAARGPGIVPALMAAIPSPSAPSHYRYALGAVTALSQMAPAGYSVDGIRRMLSDADIQTIVDLMAHPDETMRARATEALVALEDDRSIQPLIGVLDGEAVEDEAKYNAALALRQTAPTFAPPVQQRIADETQALAAPRLEQRTAKLLEQLPTVDREAAQTGWVYLGSYFGKDWSERHFTWPEGSTIAPAAGTTIQAVSNVNLRADHIRFTLDKGWQNSEILGLVRRGENVTVRSVKQVTPGFYWAEVES